MLLFNRCTLIITLSLLSLHSLAQNTKQVKLTKHLRDSLKTEVEAMLVADQQYRWMLELGETDPVKLAALQNADEPTKMRRIRDVMNNKVGLPQATKDSLERLQDANDAANFTKLSGIIARYGYPHNYIAGYKTGTILSHMSATLLDEQFFSMLKVQVQAGNMEAMEYAGLYDRIQLELHKPELYCVIDHYDTATKKSALSSPTDINATNKAREEIGLRKYGK